MRPTFFARLVNGPMFDPVVFVHILNLKSALLFDCSRMDDMIEVSSKTGIIIESVDDLFNKLVIITKGYKIAYITDIRASDENLQRISALAEDVDMLFIEAYYLAERERQAYEKAHLTAAQAGMIARMLRAKKVVPMHISPRYHDRTDKIMGEFDAAWLYS
jgi:ribonuclease BN (tRNA processing enzyme)